MHFLHQKNNYLKVPVFFIYNTNSAKPISFIAKVGEQLTFNTNSNLNEEDVDKINDKENWIIQRKVHYADVIETPVEPAKAEIRMFYFWEENKARPVAANTLSRLSKGKMIGVRYNKDKEWVGGSFCLFEQ